ncbi:Acetyltransferase (GNAT) family protein [uncultured archaeon]|nr:Acetyltransferase (GNAT) family protein [uncultured archaeon]
MGREDIRRLEEMDEFYELAIVQKDAWGLEDIDVLPAHILRVASTLMGPNGIVLGYFIDEKLVGYILTFPTSNPREVLLDMLAVSPDYQSQGIGYNLMLELRKIMLAQDIDKIFWTYDPLESVNANLYIKKLGGVIFRHLIDYYGSIDSKIHSGLPTDRFMVEWNIRSKRVENRIKNENEKVNHISDNKEIKHVEIPLNIQELKNKDINVAIEWRMKTRKLFDEYIEKKKLMGIDFIHDQINQKGIYIFKREL